MEAAVIVVGRDSPTTQNFRFPNAIHKTTMSPSTTTTTTMTNTAPPPVPTTEDVELSTAQGYDDEQIRLMEEVCIVIDENDQPVRAGTKKECPQCVYPSTD